MRTASPASVYFGYLAHQIVDVAPAPGLARFVGPHHGVSGLAIVIGGVLVRAGVAASDVAAGEADS